MVGLSLHLPVSSALVRQGEPWCHPAQTYPIVVLGAGPARPERSEGSVGAAQGLGVGVPAYIMPALT